MFYSVKWLRKSSQFSRKNTKLHIYTKIDNLLKINTLQDFLTVQVTVQILRKFCKSVYYIFKFHSLGAGGREFESRYPDKGKLLKINGLQNFRSCKSLIFCCWVHSTNRQDLSNGVSGAIPISKYSCH